jgi:hypothetical protein
MGLAGTSGFVRLRGATGRPARSDYVPSAEPGWRFRPVATAVA